MAEHSSGERTEQPTPERLRKAREEGQVPQSHEAGPILMVLALMVVLTLDGGNLLAWFLQEVRGGLSCIAPVGDAPAAFSTLLRTKVLSALGAIPPFLLAAAIAGVAGSLLASGWAFSPKALEWKLSRLSPMAGLSNLFSMRSGVQVAAAAAKLTLLTVLVYSYLNDKLGACLALRWAQPGEILAEISRLAMGVLARMAIGLAALAALEMVYQRVSYRRRMRMTRQEVKQERRQHELAPEIRRRIRIAQIQLVRHRMLQKVQKADVVVANPTHVAVALQYDPKQMKAPVVVAKGAELMCEKIKEIARAHNVPIVYRPELARAIYGAVDLDQAIPEALYVAVAEVLAMIYRLRRKTVSPGANMHKPLVNLKK